jgi:hypothetical protein
VVSFQVAMSCDLLILDVSDGKLRLRLNVGIQAWNWELEFMVMNAAVWTSSELEKETEANTHVALLLLAGTFPQFRAQSLCIPMHWPSTTPSSRPVV